jgi:RNA polymerase sigma factor (sigma-70 family)
MTDGQEIYIKGEKMTDLLQRLQSNDERAFAEVFNTYKAPIYFSILKIVKNPLDAEDCMMISFEKAFRGVKFFVPNFKFSTWLYEIARNTSFDWLRSKARRPVNDELDVRIKSKQLTPDQELIINDQVQIIERGIRELSEPNFREIMTMYHGGYKTKEIVEELNIPQGTVLNYILRAKKQLKKLIA